MKKQGIDWSSLWKNEDWWANWLGITLFVLTYTGIIFKTPRPSPWVINPQSSITADNMLIVLSLMIGIMVLFSISIKYMGGKPGKYAKAFTIIFATGFLTQIIASQTTLKTYGFEYVFWSLLLGILIRNTAGLPDWLNHAVKTELYIKTGLVLLGAEILFNVLLNLGFYGLILAWGVTPIVLYTTYSLGANRWNIEKSLALLIASATSVCGVSAAIAMAAASKAKKGHLTLTISMSLIFTVIMLVLMPLMIKSAGMSQLVGGAWIGGTIDSSGAVVAAGELLGPQAMEVAIVIKMIQNMMIGVLAFIVAVIWVLRIERDPESPRPSALDIWYRFPKFILGFIILSLISSFILNPMIGETALSNILDVTKGLRTYFFSIAFVCIGLETGFKELGKNIEGRKPLKLYLFGQTINLVMTLLFAWVLFGLILPS
ncbi:putative sulfate exporter family transporter [Candidatus Bathyarchaeota archaeon]|nr:putative sulfate exporter family transporter [Candidatus Bathyarchaeota archaeon]